MILRINRALVAVHDLAEACAAFQRGLGLAFDHRVEVPDVGAVSALLPIGDAWIQLLQPVDEGPVRRFVQQHGPGIYGVGLAVPMATISWAWANRGHNILIGPRADIIRGDPEVLIRSWLPS